MVNIREFLHKRKMKKNTKENFMETLIWEVSSLKTEVSLLNMKFRLLSEEIELLSEETKDDRDSRRDLVKDENKGTLRRKESKVRSNKRTIN